MAIVAGAARAAAGACRPRAPAARAVQALRAANAPLARAAPARRAVAARFFKFGKNGLGADAAGIYGSQGRDEYASEDVEYYFNYMGMLATEGTYDRMWALQKSGLHPIDVILLLAASENDAPKVDELLASGADATVKDLEGRTPLSLASKKEVVAALTAAAAAKAKA